MNAKRVDGSKEGVKTFSVQISICNWEQAKHFAAPIRHQVFVIEQHVPRELELDALDPACLHALAFDQAERAVGTARLLPDGHIGRMAVLSEARGQQIGSQLLRALIQAAKQRGDLNVSLNAQLDAVDFYTRHGFVCEGAAFEEAGILHVKMRA